MSKHSQHKLIKKQYKNQLWEEYQYELKASSLVKVNDTMFNNRGSLIIKKRVILLICNVGISITSLYLGETAVNGQVTSKGQHFVKSPSPVTLTVEQAYVRTLEVARGPTIANQDKD